MYWLQSQLTCSQGLETSQVSAFRLNAMQTQYIQGDADGYVKLVDDGASD